MNDEKQETLQERELMPLWEVFIRPRTGLSHSHVGSGTASSSMKATMSPAAFATPRLRATEMFASSNTRTLATPASCATAAPAGQATTTVSNLG